jgi:Papain-like cysteine protease AvrRpt2/Putative peptidoglycan binding domain
MSRHLQVEALVQILRIGSRGPQVMLLQRLINIGRRASVLREDGIFGPRTNTEVIAAQALARIAQDGTVGPATWQQLGLRVEVTHSVMLFAQPTNMTCWSAASTMILSNNMSVGPGGAQLQSGGLESSFANVQVFARSLRLTMEGPMTWTVQGLETLLRRGPLWVGGSQPAGSPTAPNSGHAVVIGAMWGNGNPDGRGTMLQIFDPWPPSVGSTYGVFYGDRIAGSPLSTMYILHR